MHGQIAPVTAAPDARGLTQILARYRAPSLTRSVIELAITAIPLVLIWALMWAAVGIDYCLCLLLAIPAAGLLGRLFIIHHVCIQGAFYLHTVPHVLVSTRSTFLTL